MADASFRLKSHHSRNLWHKNVEQVSGPYRLWHDRAVFHFLTDAQDRETYRNKLSIAVPPTASCHHGDLRSLEKAQV